MMCIKLLLWFSLITVMLMWSGLCFVFVVAQRPWFRGATICEKAAVLWPLSGFLVIGLVYAALK